MRDLMWKTLFVLVVLFGEALSIYAETIAAKNNANILVILRMMFWVTIAGFLLVPGYVMGMRLFKDIWVVSVVSITCVLICEPLLVWCVFRELPSTGSVLGFVFGVIGFACTIFIK